MTSEIEQELVDALADAHAMEAQSLTTLQAAVKVAGDPQLEALYRGALGAGVVATKNTPAKLVAVAYGYENFEVAAYEMLKRIAQQAGDPETVEMCDRILVNERQAVEKLGVSYDLALQAAGVTSA